MNRYCVFCGGKPSNKNKEHIIPKWLIKMTGDLHREITLGINWSDPNLKSRKFRFSSYTFPACKACNDNFAIIEGKVKPIFVNLFDSKQISSDESQLLLDWFDKIRVSLWLSVLTLNKNKFGINPQFHINQRVASSDRCLLIYQLVNKTKGIQFIATDTPIFEHMPSAFCLRVNQLLFVNISKEFLIHESLGLPFVESKEVLAIEDKHSHSFADGSGGIVIPEFISHFPPYHLALFQAVKPPNLRGIEGDKNLYTDDYSKTLFHSDKFYSDIYVSNQPKKLSKLNEPQVITPPPIEIIPDVSIVLAAKILELQKSLFLQDVKLSSFVGEDNLYYENKVELIIKFHEQMFDLFKMQTKTRISNELTNFFNFTTSI